MGQFATKAALGAYVLGAPWGDQLGLLIRKRLAAPWSLPVVPVVWLAAGGWWAGCTQTSLDRSLLSTPQKSCSGQ